MYTGINEPVFTVSQLNNQARQLLEEGFPKVIIEGEITGFRPPGQSAHWYFQLKDEQSILPCVMWRSAAKKVPFVPTDGMLVQATAKLTIYGPRGNYQARIEYMEPRGEGALRAAFERLRTLLKHRGWFNEEHKQSLPPFPTDIAVISSESGAATRDVFVNIWRRYPYVNLRLVATSVQGVSAKRDIAKAIQQANQLDPVPDFAILTRGGGSLEDLAAFNSEEVATAIFESEIPIVSAVGHDVDYTITDFVADKRAATPSTAAEIVTPDGVELHKLFTQYIRKCFQVHSYKYRQSALQLKNLQTRLPSPRTILSIHEQQILSLQGRYRKTLDHVVQSANTNTRNAIHRLSIASPNTRLSILNTSNKTMQNRMYTAVLKIINDQRFAVEHKRVKLEKASPISRLQVGKNSMLTNVDRMRISVQSSMNNTRRIFTHNLSVLEKTTPAGQIQSLTTKLTELVYRLNQSISEIVRLSNSMFALQSSKLNSVSPLATLERGFAVVSKPNQTKYGEIVRSVSVVKGGESLHAHIADGTIVSTVTAIITKDTDS